MCLSASPHDSSKTDAPRFTKLNADMVHHESWKPVLFWGQKVKVTRHEEITGMGRSDRVSAA